MILQLAIIGALLAPTAHAQVPVYDSIKKLVELEVQRSEAELATQRFAIGIYYDFELQTRADDDTMKPFEMKKEEYVDYSLLEKIEQMCGTQEDRKNDLSVCIRAQETLRKLVERNTWVRSLGRDLQAIASGYEAGIDGYPGQSIDVMAKLAGINYMWRAANDPFVTPILEKLTRARPWPESYREDIENKAKEIAQTVKDLEKSWQSKKDRTELNAAVWRYRHGVNYIREHEGEDCQQTLQDIDDYFACLSSSGDAGECNGYYAEERSDPELIMLQYRWCDIEDKMKELVDLIQNDDTDASQDEQIVYPSYVNKEDNFTIWMRDDDVGLQWYLPMEPVQASLFHPDYASCIEGGDIRNCYDSLGTHIIRAGRYPRKIGDEERKQEPSLLGGGAVPTLPTDVEESEIRKRNSIVPEPEEVDGICSHPFSKRGYLCRTIDSEACDVTQEQEDQLADAGTGGIILTRCNPERFKGDVAQRMSGNDICDIGGWREQIENPEEQSQIPEDTKDKQEDMLPPPCARCVVDVECKDVCERDGSPADAFVDPGVRNGVLDLCFPNNPEPKGMAYYLLMHELTHTMQLCGLSNREILERGGVGLPAEQGRENCCAVEREAYFVQCKLMAQDGILEKAGVSIDQCASVYASFSCKSFDDDPNDDDYICASDGINPNDLSNKINGALEELAPELDLPETCESALEHPRVKAVRNSLPASCEPGCQLQYANTIGNNLCYTGQCIEETHERARDIPGRVGLTAVSQGFPWDACEKEDPKLGAFEVPPATVGPKFFAYRPQLLLQQLDMELCQINGLPAQTPPIICAFDPIKRLGLPPLNLMQAADDLLLQPEEYDATGLNIQYAASAIGSRVATDMFTQYMRPASQNYADLLNTMYDVFKGIGDLKFPSTMCPRYVGDGFTCDQLR